MNFPLVCGGEAHWIQQQNSQQKKNNNKKAEIIFFFFFFFFFFMFFRPSFPQGRNSFAATSATSTTSKKIKCLFTFGERHNYLRWIGSHFGPMSRGASSWIKRSQRRVISNVHRWIQSNGTRIELNSIPKRIHWKESQRIPRIKKKHNKELDAICPAVRREWLCPAMTSQHRGRPGRRR